MVTVFKKGYIYSLLLFLYAPILTLIVFSFNDVKSRANWGGFSFRWYISLFNNPEIIDALWVTVTIAVIATLVSTLLGTLAAVGIHSMKRGMRLFTLNVSYLPMVTPDIVTGVSLMILFIFVRLPLGMVTLALSHIAFNTPYVIFAILPKLAHMDENVYEAALDLGAKPLTALWRIIIPQISAGIVSGALLSFTLSLDDFVISFFTGGDVQNLSVLVFSMARRGVNPTINALSAIMFVVVLTLLIIANRRGALDE